MSDVAFPEKKIKMGHAGNLWLEGVKFLSCGQMRRPTSLKKRKKKKVICKIFPEIIKFEL